MNEAAEKEIVRILQIVARDGLDGPAGLNAGRNLDATMDAIRQAMAINADLLAEEIEELISELGKDDHWGPDPDFTLAINLAYRIAGHFTPTATRLYAVPLALKISGVLNRMASELEWLPNPMTEPHITVLTAALQNPNMTMAEMYVLGKRLFNNPYWGNQG